MRRLAFVLLLAFPLSAAAQDNTKKPPTTLRGVLLEQLRTTHTDEDWFVPANIAVQGLTADQLILRLQEECERNLGQPAEAFATCDSACCPRSARAHTNDEYTVPPPGRGVAADSLSSSPSRSLCRRWNWPR